MYASHMELKGEVKNKKRRLIVLLPPELLKAARRRALEEDRPLREWLADAMAAKLAEVKC